MGIIGTHSDVLRQGRIQDLGLVREGGKSSAEKPKAPRIYGAGHGLGVSCLLIFPGGEHATYLIIANVKTLSRDDSNSVSSTSDGHEFGGHGHLAPLDPPMVCGRPGESVRVRYSYRGYPIAMAP